MEVAQGPAPRAARELVPLAPTAGARRALARFVAAHGGVHVLWDAATGVPAQMVLRGAPAASDALAAARGHLAEHVDLLAPGCTASDFELVGDDQSGELRSLGFAQRSRGRAVLGGQVSFRYVKGRLVAIASQALPCAAAVPASAGPIAAGEAQQRALAWLARDGMSGLAPRGDVSAPALLPRIGERGVLAVDEVVAVVVDVASPRSRFRVFVDATSGAPIAREQLLSFAFEARYDVPLRRPTDARLLRPAAFIGFVVGGVSKLSDLLGVVELDAPAAAVATVDSPAVRILDEAGPTASLAFDATPGQVVTWSAADDELVDAQITTAISAGIVKRRVQAIAGQLPWLAGQLVATVNIDDVCNAFSDGDTINFFRSGPCENTGRLPDVVYHEFGHSIHTQALIPGVGAFNVSLSEGISDYLSATITDDSAVGRGFFYDNEPIRELDPLGYEWRWPEDKGEVHDEGRIIGGALWDLRKALIQKLGPVAGVERTDRLWYESIRRAVDIPSMFIETLVADDDNGDLNDGTPNACEIAKAYEVHGLRPITLGAPELTLLPADPSGTPVLLNFQAFLPQCGLPPINATLEWRLRGGGGMAGSAAMASTEGGLLAYIPPFPDDSVIQYKVNLEAGSLVQSLPQNPVDPWYEHYVGPVTPLYCTSFDGGDPAGEGWSYNGAWAWGAPEGGLDPEGAYSGARVLGVGLGGEGLYSPFDEAAATSPAIDTGGFKRVRLQYRRWLTVEDAFYDQATISADGAGLWQNFAGSDDFSSSNHHIDEEWRFHDVDISEQAADGQVSVRFAIQSDGGLELGGWNIDELCVVGVLGSDEPLCGDGVLDPLEGCDDGASNSDSAPDACRTDCTRPRCGDGVVDSAEACDDGDVISGDGCSEFCRDEGGSGGESTTSSGSSSGGETDTETAGQGSDLTDRGCVCTADAEGPGRASWVMLSALALGLRRRRRG